MKITKNQIEALISQELIKNKEAKIKELEIFKNSPSVTAELKKLVKEYKSISPTLKKYLANYWVNTPTEATFLNKMVANYKYKTPEINIQELRNKITIATIEAKDLAELKKILKLI